MKHYFSLILFLTTFHVGATSPLEPVKLDHPRDTMASFMEAMNDYRTLKLQGKTKQAHFRLSRATRTLKVPLLEAPQINKKAFLLKEIIDRVIVIDLKRIPNNSQLETWRLKGTEIYISKVKEGDRTGQFLFSEETVRRLEAFYGQVKELPYLEGSGQGALYEAPFYEKHVPGWAKDKFLAVSLWKWLVLLFVVLLGNILRFFVQNIMSLLTKISPNTNDSIRKNFFYGFQKPLGWLAASLVWVLTVHVLDFEGLWFTVLNVITKSFLSFSLIWIAYSFINILAIFLEKLSMKTETTLDDKLYPFVLKSLRIFVVVCGVLMALQNMGVNIFSVLTGLGIGGLALALAAKDTASNFFGSLMILIDHPFSAGDWVVAGETEGTVEDIGLRSTKIRTFYDSVITVPNAEVAALPIDNMGKRQMRRVKTTLGVTYGTPPEKLEDFIKKVKELILAHPLTNKEKCHVVFTDYGASSLDILVYFFMVTKDWEEELIEKQAILISILNLAHKEGISFAFPTRTVHIEKD